MLTEYCNQSITRKTVASVNDCNEATYTTSTIKGRKEPYNKLIRTAKGEEKICSTVVYTATAVIVGDLLDDDIVLAVKTQVDIGGSVQFHEVYLA
jgi:hypothetical protein